ncbi:hypothetical protein [Alteribacter aurantiacus]|nr:hypothetical protein [Alteribacter aurantiacus]
MPHKKQAQNPPQVKQQAKSRQASQSKVGYGDKKTEGPDQPST